VTVPTLPLDNVALDTAFDRRTKCIRKQALLFFFLLLLLLLLWQSSNKY
jgi:hypothetical protein